MFRRLTDIRATLELLFNIFFLGFLVNPTRNINKCHIAICVCVCLGRHITFHFYIILIANCQTSAKMNKINSLNFIKRSISTSSQLNGKRNFRKFLLYNKRGPRDFKKAQIASPHPDIPIDKRGVKDTGYTFQGVYHEVPEKIPQLIVPDLTGCTLKPYVSYKTPEVIQSKFTSEDLFNAVYTKKIVEDFKNGKLREDGSAEEPSENELLDAETARIRARQTGSDVF